MKHVCIFGGGSAIADEVIKKYLADGDRVTAICRYTIPSMTNPNLQVINVKEIHLLSYPIHVLITLAGSVYNGLIQQLSDKAWQQVIDNCLTSVGKAISQLSPLLANDGNIVIVGSIVGSTGGYGCANYASAKAGLQGLTKAVANELIPRRIRVNHLELGYVNAGMGLSLPEKVRLKALEQIPLGRFADVDEVVDVIQFLGNTRYMTGNTLTFAGGL